MNFNKLSMISILALSFIASAAFAGKHDDDNSNEKCCKRIAVTTTRDCGKGSLRWAIEKANLRDRAEGAHIVFKLEKSDCGYNRDTKTWVICPETDLPEITAPNVKILGLSQCGSEENCNSINEPSNEWYRIELCGPGLDEQAIISQDVAVFAPIRGISFARPAVGGEISGLYIYGFPQAGVITSAPSTTVRALNLSTNSAGAVRQNLSDIVFLPSAVRGVVGGALNADLIQGAGRGGSLPSTTSGVLAGSILGGTLTSLAPGLIGQNIRANLNRAGTQPVNLTATYGIIVDTSATPVVQDEIDASFSAVRSSAHKIANFGALSFSKIVLNDVAVGTTADTSTQTTGNAGNGFAFNQRNLAAGKSEVVAKAGIVEATNIITRGNALGGIVLGTASDAPLRSFTVLGLISTGNSIGMQTRDVANTFVSGGAFTNNSQVAVDVQEPNALAVERYSITETTMESSNQGGIALQTQIPMTLAASRLVAPSAIVIQRPTATSTLPTISQPLLNDIQGVLRLKGF